MLGCGAIGGTVAAGLVRDGHDVLVCDADPAVVAAINADGLRIEGPVEQFTARPCRGRARANCPTGSTSRSWWPVKQQHTAAAAALLAGRLRGDGFVVSLQNGLPSPALAAAARTRPGGPGVRQLRRRRDRAGRDDARQPGHASWSASSTGRRQRPGRRAGRGHRRRPGDAACHGLLWGKEAYGATLFATAVSDLPIHDGVRRPRLPPAADRRRRRGAGAGAGPAAAAGRIRPGRPAGIAGPAGRVQPAVGEVALGRSTATWRSGTARPRPRRSSARCRGSCSAGPPS